MTAVAESGSALHGRATDTGVKLEGKARPILFSAPMVRALLAGTKTQTRRTVKPTPGAQSEWLTPEGLSLVPSIMVGQFDCGFGAQLTHPMGGPGGWIRCPYGRPGDLLIVRETWKPHSLYAGMTPREMPQTKVFYKADNTYAPSNTPWVPSIHMPRWASRLTLEITDVRVERLQAISEADAEAEGLFRWDEEGPAGAFLPAWGWRPREDAVGFGSPSAAYRGLWTHINGPDSWAANPWVWAVSFAVHRANVDALKTSRPA